MQLLFTVPKHQVIIVLMNNVFDAAAEDFIELTPLLWDRVGKAVVDAAPPSLGARVLDACCGAGSSALPAAQKVGPAGLVDAVDLSEALVAATGQRLTGSPLRSRVRPAVADIIDWHGGPYDQIFCVLGLPFLPDPAAGAAHLRGLLRPGGKLVIAHWRSSDESLDMMELGRQVGAMVEERAGLAPPAPAARRAQVINEMTRAESMRSFVAGLGLAARVTVARVDVPLTARSLRLLLVGSAFRAVVEGLPQAQRERVIGGLADRLEGQVLDASVVVGIGTCEELRTDE